MNQIFNQIKSKCSFGRRTITVTLSPGQAFLCGIIFLAIIIWFFFLGLILGRGQYPEQVIPEISKIMPRSNGTDTPLKVLTVEPFSDSNVKMALTEEEVKPVLKTATTPSKNNSPQSEKKIEQKTTAKSLTPKKAVQKAKKIALKPSTLSAATNGVFDYVYQVASFKDAQSANNLANKLKKEGLKTRVAIAESGTIIWRRVVIDFKGTPADTNILRQRLSKYKIEKIVMLKKSAIK